MGCFAFASIRSMWCWSKLLICWSHGNISLANNAALCTWTDGHILFLAFQSHAINWMAKMGQCSPVRRLHTNNMQSITPACVAHLDACLYLRRGADSLYVKVSALSYYTSPWFKSLKFYWHFNHRFVFDIQSNGEWQFDGSKTGPHAWSWDDKSVWWASMIKGGPNGPHRAGGICCCSQGNTVWLRCPKWASIWSIYYPWWDLQWKEGSILVNCFPFLHLVPAKH